VCDPHSLRANMKKFGNHLRSWQQIRDNGLSHPGDVMFQPCKSFNPTGKMYKKLQL